MSGLHGQLQGKSRKVKYAWLSTLVDLSDGMHLVGTPSALGVDEGV